RVGGRYEHHGSYPHAHTGRGARIRRRSQLLHAPPTPPATSSPHSDRACHTAGALAALCPDRARGVRGSWRRPLFMASESRIKLGMIPEAREVRLRPEAEDTARPPQARKVLEARCRAPSTPQSDVKRALRSGSIAPTPRPTRSGSFCHSGLTT